VPEINFSVFFTTRCNKVVLIPSDEGGGGGVPSLSEPGTRLKMTLFTVMLISLCRQSTALAERVPLRGCVS
jgi:hypothetical protein